LSNFILSNSIYLSTSIFVDRYEMKGITNVIEMIKCTTALKSLYEVNAGGSSEISEALSMNYFNDLYGINDFILEMDVKYDVFHCSMCDFVMGTDNNRIGVSVTRALNFHDKYNYTVEDAERLLRKKLFGLIVARSGISKLHNFDKCILHIWCINEAAAMSLHDAYNNIISETNITNNDDGINDVVVIITVCDNDSIYTNRC